MCWDGAAVLGNAYKTLHSPDTRRLYDLTGQPAAAGTRRGDDHNSDDDDNVGATSASGEASAEAVFAAVAEQLLREFLGGNFGNIVRGIEVVQEWTGAAPVEKERVTAVLQSAHEAALRLQQYVAAVQFDVARLEAHRHAWHAHAWSDLTGQTLTLVRMGRTVAAIVAAAPLPDVGAGRLVPRLLRWTDGALGGVEAILTVVDDRTRTVRAAAAALWTLWLGILAWILMGRRPASRA
jgi:hypothetical protein